MIDSPRLRLREFQSSDVSALLTVYGDPKVVEHMSFEPRSRQQVETAIATAITGAQTDPRTEYSLAAVDRTGALIGFARLAVDTQHPGQNSGQIGFALAAASWGQGAGTEVVRLLLSLGFEHLGLYRIWGARSPLNEISAHVMEKSRMVEEGRIRGHLLVRGKWRDSIVHSILAPEWKKMFPGHSPDER